MAIGNERTNSLINYRTGSYLDEKPTGAKDGDLFEEIDGNKDLYVFHKGDWIVKISKVSIVGSLANVFTLQNSTIVAGVGTPYTTKGEKTITIETVGTNVVSSQINFEAQYSTSGAWYPIFGNMISGGINSPKQVNTTIGINEVWQFDSTNVFAIRSNLISISGAKEVIQNTVAGTITTAGNATAIVTANGMTGSPKTVSVAVQAGVLQVETATVAGTITTTGNASVVVTANGMSGSPKTVSVAVSAGTAQVETATVAGTITTAGNANVTITASGMTGSPKTIAVAVALSDTADLVAGKIRTALGLDADVIAKFNVSGTTTGVILTSKTNIANDSTLNIAIADGTCVGLTATPTSVNTTAGVIPDDASAVAGKIRTALGLDTDVSAKFTISGATTAVILTAKTKADNDTTLNISIANGTCAGLTSTPTSANTTAGIAPDSATAVASKVVTALIADSTINGFFTISSSNAVITITAKLATTNDATMNLSINNGTCVGLTLSNATITTLGTLASITTKGTGSFMSASAQSVSASITGSFTRLSIETKPIEADGAQNGNDLLEVDTGKVYVFYQGVWRLI